MTSFQDLALAERDRAWDGGAAEKRVRKWAGAEEEPNQKYGDAHLWYDSEKKQNFTAYKMLVADVVNGKLVAVPRAIMAAAGVLDGARGGVNIRRRRHRPSQEPPGQVLQEDGRIPALEVKSARSPHGNHARATTARTAQAGDYPMNTEANDDGEQEARSGDDLEKAAEQGPLPGAEALDEAERRGEEDSDTADADERAQDAADGDVVGGINMH